QDRRFPKSSARDDPRSTDRVLGRGEGVARERRQGLTAPSLAKASPPRRITDTCRSCRSVIFVRVEAARGPEPIHGGAREGNREASQEGLSSPASIFSDQEGPCHAVVFAAALARALRPSAADDCAEERKRTRHVPRHPAPPSARRPRCQR